MADNQLSREGTYPTLFPIHPARLVCAIQLQICHALSYISSTPRYPCSFSVRLSCGTEIESTTHLELLPDRDIVAMEDGSTYPLHRDVGPQPFACWRLVVV